MFYILLQFPFNKIGQKFSLRPDREYGWLYDNKMWKGMNNFNLKGWKFFDSRFVKVFKNNSERNIKF